VNFRRFERYKIHWFLPKAEVVELKVGNYHNTIWNA